MNYSLKKKLIRKHFFSKKHKTHLSTKFIPPHSSMKNFQICEMKIKKNYFEFKGVTIPEYCKEYEEKILAKTIKSIFSNDPNAEKNVYTMFFQDFIWDFACCATDVKVCHEKNAKNETIKIGSNINSLAITPDGLRVISHKNENLKMYDINRKQEIPIFGSESKHSAEILCVKITRDGSKIFSVSNKDIKIWMAVSGKLVKTFESKNHEFNKIAITHDGSNIYVGNVDGKIILYDANTSENNLSLRAMMRSLPV